MALSKDEILDAIAEMSVMDIVELVEAMEEKFGVSAAAAVAVAAPAAGGDAGAAAAQQTRSRAGTEAAHEALRPHGAALDGCVGVVVVCQR